MEAVTLKRRGGNLTIELLDTPATLDGPMAKLLEPQELAELGPAEAVRVPLDLVDANPQNPRTDLIELDYLADNIRSFGLLQPVTVRRAGERYELLGGHRRRAAFALLREREPQEPKWRTIPAVVRTEQDDDRAFLMLLSSQLHTRSWRPREEAAALERLIMGGRNLKEVGEALNRNESWASKRLRVYADAVLSGYVQTVRVDGSGPLLKTSVAEELLIVVDANVRRELAERAATEDWSQDRVRGEVRALRRDKQVRDIAKRAGELYQLLSTIDAGKIPDDAAITLNLLRRRILALSRAPVIPTIAAAQQVAGVSDKPTRRTPKKPKRRVMPAPA